MKRIFSILTLVLLGTFVQAQVFDMMNSLRTVTLRARVLDKSTGEPVTYAAVCLTPQGDTTITAFGLSGEDGRVAVEGVSQGRYILTAEVLGYKSFSKDFELSRGISSVRDSSEKYILRRMWSLSMRQKYLQRGTGQ